MKKYDKSIEYLNKLSIQLEQEEKEYKENVLVIKSFLLSQIYTEIGKQDEALKLLKSSKKLMDSIKKQYFQDLKILYIISLEGYNLKYDIHNFSKTSLEKLLSLSDKNSNIVHLKITFKLLSQYYFRTNNIQAYNSLTLTYEKYLEKINSANNTVFSLYLIESLEHSHFLRENERLYKEIIFLIITIFIILIISYKKITILNKKAKIDVLTNIGNRLAFTETFDEIKNENFFMFIFDIDNFKKINDTYGHDFGDEVLSVVGKILKTIENKEISIYRVGGEEFAIIFTHFNESFAIECCEYIRKSIENIKWKYPIIVTISGGFSNSCENTYLECDKRLYKAKNSGKNMIIYQNIDKGEY